MIVELGHFALCLALVAALIQMTLPLWGIWSGSASAMTAADNAAQVQFAAIATAFGALVYAYVVSDFSVANVALNSHSAKPLIYKVSGVWANHEGSMLLWVLILALFGLLISIFGGAVPVRFRSTVLAVQAMIGVGFLAFILLTSNPFQRVAMPPLDGNGMNPLLQDLGVALHPPLLYVGYVGFSTAFSFAVAALISGRIDPSWARWMRPWVLLAWSGLTAGIALGSWWAYYELGWGGFWFWDPVENASFMPWLLGTALLHSAIVVEKRFALVKWTILLAIFTFGLSLIGTFLVRSGILSSVHAFATDPARGSFILGLLALYIGGSLALFAWRAPAIQEGGQFEPVSREGGLLLNNLLLAVATGIVFVGTLYPVFLDALTGQKITVGAPYFNMTFLPVFALVMVAAGAGTFLSWKKARLGPLLKYCLLTLAVAVVGTLVVAIALGLSEPAGLFGIAVALWLVAASAIDLGRRAGLPGATLAVATQRVMGLPRSTWGLYLAHIGVAVAAAGVVAISIWRVEEIQIHEIGKPVTVGGYTFTLADVGQAKGPNYQASIATIKVEQDGQLVQLLFPERRWYPVEKKPTTEAAISTLWHGDLYAVLGDPNGKNAFVTRYYYNPGVPWMWLGALMIALSGLISLTDRRLRVGAPTPARKPKLVLQPAE